MNPNRRGTLRALAFGAAGGLNPLVGTGANVPLNVAPIRTQPVPASYFGLHVHDPTAVWPDFQFGRLRLWDTRTTWFNLQPERGRWDFTRLDAIVNVALKRGVEVVLPLGMTPRWAAARPEEPSPYNLPGAASEPSDIQLWQRYVQTVGERYKGRIRCYELWNEVNAGAGFFTGTPTALLELQRVAFETLKVIDLGITFVAPSTEGESEHKFVWFERYLSLMQGRYADAVSYHLYSPRKSPEAMLPMAERARKIMTRTGCGHMPLWNTESGYRVDWGQSKVPGGTMATWPNLAPRTAAAWVVRAYLLGWAAGLDAFFWYAYDNQLMGMVSSALKPTEVSDAMKLVSRWLAGSVVERVEKDTDSVMWAQTSLSGVRRWWVWTSDDVIRAWSVPAGWGARFSARINGDPRALQSGGVVLLGGMPILLARDSRELSLR